VKKGTSISIPAILERRMKEKERVIREKGIALPCAVNARIEEVLFKAMASRRKPDFQQPEMTMTARRDPDFRAVPKAFYGDGRIHDWLERTARRYRRNKSEVARAVLWTWVKEAA